MWCKRVTTMVAAILATTTWHLQTGHAADDIVIGFAVANSGVLQAYDGDPARMAKLFIDQINEKGGLLGRNIRLVEFDTKSDRAEASKAGLGVVHAGAALAI